MDPAPTSAATLLGLRESALSVDEAIAAVMDPACGGVCVFVGVVRDHDRGQSVSELDYTAHPSALDRLEEVCQVVLQRTPGVRLAALHRVGRLTIGDIAVVVAAAAAHRDEAFRAARDLIDTLKSEVPIWKHQSFSDGGTEWVGLP